MLIVFSVIGYILVAKFIAEINKFSGMVENDDETSATIELYGLPVDSDLVKTQNDIEAKVMEKYGQEVARVLVTPNLSEAYKEWRIT